MLFSCKPVFVNLLFRPSQGPLRGGRKSYFSLCACVLRASLVVRNLPAMWETQVRSLGQEEPLEEEMATHSSILAWRIPWTEEPDGLQSTGSQRVRYD